MNTLKYKSISVPAFILILSLMVFTTQGQIIPEYNMYNQNLLLINPASCGINGNIQGYLGHKDQWSDIKNAPQLSYFSVDGMLTPAMGAGLVVQNQQMGIFNFNNLSLNYAYRIAFSRSHALSFGVNFNLIQNHVSTEGLYEEEKSDPALMSNKFDETLLSNAAGMEYRVSGFTLGISSPLIYSYQEEEFLQTAYLYTAYAITWERGLYKLQPSALLRYNKHSPHQVNASLMFEWDQTAWVQGTYKTNQELMASAGVFIKYIGIGYAYSMNMHPLNTVSRGSHEVVLFFYTPYSINKRRAGYRPRNRRR